MKRIGYVYEDIISVENCKAAIQKATIGKRKRGYVKRVLENIDSFAVDLSNRLQTANFLTEYTSRTICDKSSCKEREILIPKFYPDQCAHHALMNIIAPHILKSSYYWSCANIKGKGIDLAAKGTSRATSKRSRAKYCLKYDITKFYPSIDHDILKAKLRRKFKDEKALRLLDLVIDSCDKGLPIGNYTSPIFAELYLQETDAKIKEHYKAKYYIRYADDGIILGANKRKLHSIFLGLSEDFRKIGLTIKSNWQVFKILYKGKGRKIDFVGRCYAKGFATIRKRTALRFIRQSRRIKRLQDEKANISYHQAVSYISRCACLKHSSSQGLKVKYFQPINIGQLKRIIRYESTRKQLAAAG